ncbi:MAG: hypothetical protein EOP53_11900 [Sphingobacteriales bacterium]|nr:MAG: hypothetical protein EOP53_11900 [Sphingobacteriales bacterium]
MISIEINDEILDLTPGTSIRFELVSPLFNINYITAAYTFPFTLPLTPRNKRILGFPHIINNKSSLTKKHTVRIKVLDHAFDGILVVNRTGKRDISVSYYSQEKSFASVIEKKKLGEMSLGGVRHFGATTMDIVNHAKATTTGTIKDYDYVFFPYQNPDFYGDLNPDFDGIVNKWDFVNNTFYSNATSYFTQPNHYNLSPCIYAFYLLRQCFEEHGITVKGSIFTDEELMQLVIYNNYALDKKLSPSDYTNVYSNDIDLRNHVPEMTIQEFLIEIRKPFFLNFLFSFNKQEVEVVTIRDVLASNKYKDWTKKLSAEDLELTQNDDGYIFRFERDGNDGITPVSDFTKNKIIGNLEIWNTVPFPGHWDDSGELFELRLHEPTNQYYVRSKVSRFTGNLAELWKLFSENLAPYKVGDGAEEINVKFSPWLQIPTVISGDYPSIPTIKNTGYSEIYNEDEQEKPAFGTRLTFYRGMKTHGEGEYPLASSVNYWKMDFHYPSIFESLGNYSLFWSNAAGLFTQWYEKWIEALISHKALRFKLKLSITDIFNFSFKDKIRIQENEYLVKRLSFSASEKGISPVEAEMHRL